MRDVTTEASKRRGSICCWFWTYLAVNTFDTKLYSLAIIGIDPGRKLGKQHSRDSLSGGDVPGTALSKGPGAGQRVNRFLLPQLFLDRDEFLKPRPKFDVFLVT